MDLQTFPQLNKIVFFTGVSFQTFPDVLIHHHNQMSAVFPEPLKKRSSDLEGYVEGPP